MRTHYLYKTEKGTWMKCFLRSNQTKKEEAMEAHWVCCFKMTNMGDRMVLLTTVLPCPKVLHALCEARQENSQQVRSRWVRHPVNSNIIKR